MRRQKFKLHSFFIVVTKVFTYFLFTFRQYVERNKSII